MATEEARWGGWQGVSEAHIHRRSVTREQRSQTLQIASARRVAPNAFGVVPRSRTRQEYAPSSRLAQAKNHHQRGPSQYFNSLLKPDFLILNPFLAADAATFALPKQTDPRS